MTQITNWPSILQGGMGIGVSNWRLARAVSQAGQIGTVSLVALPHVAARRLQLGDPDMERALSAFPIREVSERIRAKYWQQPGSPIPMFTLHPNRELSWLTIFAAYAEVWLAKEGHEGIVAGNLLEKVQLPTLLTFVGALWAGIDVLIIGAGLPTQIPDVLDALCAKRPAQYRLHVLVEGGESQTLTFDLEQLLVHLSSDGRDVARTLSQRRPAFFPIVSLDATAGILWNKTKGRCDGFVVEHPVIAGGHNPSPRGWKGAQNERGEPIYTERDEASIEKMRHFGVPFWLAGGYARPDKRTQALLAGAAGIQCGSIFALSRESGLDPSYRQSLIRLAYRGELQVLSDPLASPTGFPFQVVQMPGTVSENATYEHRTRLCNLGYLRVPVSTAKGMTYRCAAEPVADYVHKGGLEADTVGRKCLCNHLLSVIGLGMVHEGVAEPAIITLGKDTGFLPYLIENDMGSYSATAAIRYLLGT